MASFESVSWKMHRAGVHWIELTKEVAAYLDTQPGGLVEQPDSTPERKHYRYRETSPLPARLGIIAGDCLQNMRSALDYLVWELVLANGESPTERTMFPVSMTAKAWQGALDRKQLNGVSDRAQDVIHRLQPYLLQRPEMSALHTLDLLTNINKHRRVPVTSLQGAADSVQFEFLHLSLTVERREGDNVLDTFKTRLYVSIDDSIAKGREICLILNTLAQTLSKEVLPQFTSFFPTVGNSRGEAF